MFKAYKAVVAADAEVTAARKITKTESHGEVDDLQQKVRAAVNAIKEQENYDKTTQDHIRYLYDIGLEFYETRTAEISLWLCEYGYPGEHNSTYLP